MECEHDNEPSSIEYREILEQLNNWHPLRKDSTPSSYSRDLQNVNSAVLGVMLYMFKQVYTHLGRKFCLTIPEDEYSMFLRNVCKLQLTDME
jgi:hypothetical protein